MRWILIVDHYGDHAIRTFDCEKQVEDFLLAQKYYTVGYNAGFTREVEMSYDKTQVVFRDRA